MTAWATLTGVLIGGLASRTARPGDGLHWGWSFATGMLVVGGLVGQDLGSDNPCTNGPAGLR